MTSPLFAARKVESDQARHAISILEGPEVAGGSVGDLRRRTRAWTERMLLVMRVVAI